MKNKFSRSKTGVRDKGGNLRPSSRLVPSAEQNTKVHTTYVPTLIDYTRDVETIIVGTTIQEAQG